MERRKMIKGYLETRRTPRTCSHATVTSARWSRRCNATTRRDRTPPALDTDSTVCATRSTSGGVLGHRVEGRRGVKERVARFEF